MLKYKRKWFFLTMVKRVYFRIEKKKENHEKKFSFIFNNSKQNRTLKNLSWIQFRNKFRLGGFLFFIKLFITIKKVVIARAISPWQSRNHTQHVILSLSKNPVTILRKIFISQKSQRKFTASLLTFLLLLQTIIGVFAPVNIFTTPGKISLQKADADWYATGGTWSYRKAITIDNTKVPNTDQSNFPILISHTDPVLKHTSNGGKVTDLQGDDIIFTASDGNTKLDHEIEKYDNSTGEIIAWVKVPTLSSSTNTTIYIYYTNSSITTSQENISGVWDDGGSNNFKMVQHLSEDPSTGAPQSIDSTQYNNDGTSGGTMTSGDQVTGRIDGSLDFDGVDDKITISDDSTLDITNTITLSTWVNVTADPVYTAKSDISTDSQFTNRKLITITTTGTSTPVNYQVKVTVPYDSDMQTDFQDVRFNTTAGTYIDYWIESSTTSTTADIWLELPDAIADPGSDDIYMYYGN
ncbi:MAG: DUF2341 domain-containing protein, partial [Candidatus Pacebacteria bacterium]|nr:DUF2341 domain-containing protein [Candidatus Paceibacterota bacterium]